MEHSACSSAYFVRFSTNTHHLSKSDLFRKYDSHAVFLSLLLVQKDKSYTRQCKMSSKNCPVKGLYSRCLSVWGPEPHTLPLTHCIRVYSICVWVGGGGGGELNHWRRLEGQQFTKLGRKYQHDWLYLQSINSDKHLPQSPFTGQFFRWRHFALISI